jgi:hypothetical protein
MRGIEARVSRFQEVFIALENDRERDVWAVGVDTLNYFGIG